MDERVEILSTADHGTTVWVPRQADKGGYWYCGYCRTRFDDDKAARSHRSTESIAALEAEGYTVARLERSGFTESSGKQKFPLYRIIDAPAVEEAEPGAGWVAQTTDGLGNRGTIRFAAPAGTKCPTCGGNGEFLDALAKGADRYVPCPTCSPNETSEQ